MFSLWPPYVLNRPSISHTLHKLLNSDYPKFHRAGLSVLNCLSGGHKYILIVTRWVAPNTLLKAKSWFGFPSLALFWSWVCTKLRPGLEVEGVWTGTGCKRLQRCESRDHGCFEGCCNNKRIGWHYLHRRTRIKMYVWMLELKVSNMLAWGYDDYSRNFDPTKVWVTRLKVFLNLPSLTQ